MRSKACLSALLIMVTVLPAAVASGPEGKDDGNIHLNPVAASSFPASAFRAINAYTYNTAFGVRGIGTSGVTIKHFTTRTTAIEGIIGFGPGAFSLTALWERYTAAFDEPGLNWYYGVGGHLATQTDWVYYDGVRHYRRADGDFGIGIDGIFGIEYKINEVPIAVSLDMKPFLEVTTNGDAYLAIDPGLGVKFTF